MKYRRSDNLRKNRVSRAPRGARGLKLHYTRNEFPKLIQSCPSRGTWIEMAMLTERSQLYHCRAPRGARGLKLNVFALASFDAKSCPSRGTWIEMSVTALPPPSFPCRAPRGARGLKSAGTDANVFRNSRAPRGARGLKYVKLGRNFWRDKSCPSRGTWIEICPLYTLHWWTWRSCTSRGTWIEILRPLSSVHACLCRAPRGARGLKLAVSRFTGQYSPSRAPRGARGLKSASITISVNRSFVVPLAGHVD